MKPRINERCYQDCRRMFMRGMAERLSLSFDEIHRVWFDDVMHCLCLSWVQVQQDLLRPLTAPNCCYRGRGSAPKWYVFFASSSVIIASVESRQPCRSAIRMNAPCGVRYVACHVQVALLLSILDPPWCQWCSDLHTLDYSATITFGCASVRRTFLVG